MRVWISGRSHFWSSSPTWFKILPRFPSKPRLLCSVSALFSLISMMNNFPRQKYLHSDIKFSKFFPSNIYYTANIIYHRSNITSIKTHIHARNYDLFNNSVEILGIGGESWSLCSPKSKSKGGWRLTAGFIVRKTIARNARPGSQPHKLDWGIPASWRAY